jgi:ribosomal protein S27AE
VVQVLTILTPIAIAYIKATAKECPWCGKELTIINHFYCTKCRIQLLQQ